MRLSVGDGAPGSVARLDRDTAGRAAYWAVLGLVVAAGGWCRVHSLGRSLWADEAWVANAVLAPDLGGMLYYDAWLQTSPPLFLVLVRLVVAELGVANATLRLVPVIAGLLALAAFAALAGRLLARPYALLALILFAFSPELIEFSQTLKPYSSDVLASVLLLALTLGYMKARSRAKAYLAAAALLALGFLSYSAVVFVPALVLATVVDVSAEARGANVRDRVRPRSLDLTLVTSTAAGVSVVNWWFFVRPNRAAHLDAYWAGGFPSADTLAEVLLFGKRAAGALVAPLSAVAPPHPGDLSWLWHVAGACAGALLVLGALALACAAVRRRRRPRDLARAALLGCPFVSLVALNLLGLYPLGNVRTSLFIFPVVLLVLAFGVAALGSTAAVVLAGRRCIPAERARSVRRAVAVCALIVAVAELGAEAWATSDPPLAAVAPMEDAEGAVAFLGRHVGPRDTLYVHASFQEQFKLYARSKPIRARRVVEGRTGYLCCARRTPPDRDADPERRVAGEIPRMDLPRLRGSLWLVFTQNPKQWVRHDPALFDRALSDLGCDRTLTAPFVNLQVARYACPGRHEASSGAGLSARAAAPSERHQRAAAPSARRDGGKVRGGFAPPLFDVY